jgi:thioredoxin 1
MTKSGAPRLAAFPLQNPPEPPVDATDVRLPAVFLCAGRLWRVSEFCGFFIEAFPVRLKSVSYVRGMPTFTPKIFAACVALVIGPPLAVLILHYDDLKPKPVEASTATGHVLFFTADWCGVCQRVKPVVAQLRREGFDIRTVNVDSRREQAERFGIHGIPTFVLIRDGEEIRRTVGGVSAEQLRDLWR